MKITGQAPLSDAQIVSDKTQAIRPAEASKQESAASAKAQPSSASDAIVLKTLQLIRETSGDALDVRPDRIEALRASIAEGRYEVSNQQIAHAMLRDLLT